DPRNDGIPPGSAVTLQIMKEVMLDAGPSPDPALITASTPDARREWCINTAIVDPATHSIIFNSEDGIHYRWSMDTCTFRQAIRLTDGIGQAYTPTAIGPDGTVYAIQDAQLFAVGAVSNVNVSVASSVIDDATYGQPVTFTVTVNDTASTASSAVQLVIDGV